MMLVNPPAAPESPAIPHPAECVVCGAPSVRTLAYGWRGTLLACGRCATCPPAAVVDRVAALAKALSREGAQ